MTVSRLSCEAMPEKAASLFSWSTTLILSTILAGIFFRAAAGSLKKKVLPPTVILSTALPFTFTVPSSPTMRYMPRSTLKYGSVPRTAISTAVSSHALRPPTPNERRSHFAGSLAISSHAGMLPAKTSRTGLRPAPGSGVSAIARPAKQSLPYSKSVNTTGVGQFSRTMRDDSASHLELYSLPTGYLHAMATQSLTLRPTSSLPSSGEIESGFVSSSLRRFVRKPTEHIVTLRSGCAARTRR